MNKPVLVRDRLAVRKERGEVLLDGRRMDESDATVRAAVAAALDDGDFFLEIVNEEVAGSSPAGPASRPRRLARPVACPPKGLPAWPVVATL